MSKTKKLLIQIVGCLALGTMLGVAFWWLDGGKTSKKASDCLGGVSQTQGRALKSADAKVYRGRWHKDYLEVINWRQKNDLQRQ